MHQLIKCTFEHRSRVQDFLLHEVQLAVVAVAQSHQITLQMQGGVLIVRLIRQPPCANNRTITTDIVTLGSAYGVCIYLRCYTYNELYYHYYNSHHQYF